ncbi:MAG: ABC transporter permease, partial [Treponema sp.]|nr:ABC transporter permease [Treponema sp.]
MMNVRVYRRVSLFIAKALFLFLAVSALAFALVKNSPLDPVQAYIGADASLSPEQREKIAERWGVNEEPVAQYFKWLGALCRGDFGTSIIFRQPVLRVIAQRTLSSCALMGAAWLLSGLLGFALGIIAAAFRGKWPDRVVKAYCFTLASTPTFWLGLLL